MHTTKIKVAKVLLENRPSGKPGQEAQVHSAVDRYLLAAVLPAADLACSL
jgi:hypothetical protein